MLTHFDDFPLHQTPEPVAHPATSDKNFYDRYFFNGFARDGSLFFGLALGLYPNRRVMDASFSVLADGRQLSIHASRLAPLERGETRVGPISIEVLEPLRTLRVRVAENPGGLACDLVFRARTAAIEEPRATLRAGTQIVMDSTRLTQFGRWTGTLEIEGRRLEIAPDARARRARPLLGHPPGGRARDGRAGGSATIVLALGAIPLRRCLRAPGRLRGRGGPRLARGRRHAARLQRPERVPGCGGSARATRGADRAPDPLAARNATRAQRAHRAGAARGRERRDRARAPAQLPDARPRLPASGVGARALEGCGGVRRRVVDDPPSWLRSIRDTSMCSSSAVRAGASAKASACWSSS